MNTVKQSYLEHENLTGCSRTLSGELRTSPMSQKLSPENLKDTVHLLYFASKGNADAVREILNDGVDVNLVDYDGRTALHLAASEGKTDVIELLVSAGAEINPMDRWGNTPLADAQRCGFDATCDLLISLGGAILERQNSLDSLKSAGEMETDPTEIDFSDHSILGRGHLGEVILAKWRGTEVVVEKVEEDISNIQGFRKEFSTDVSELQRLRHPQIAELLGAVTLSKPFMLMREYCEGGTLKDTIQKTEKMSLKTILRYALDAARGISYLHKHKPEPIIHGNLTPSNLLLDGRGHLKVTNFRLHCIRSPKVLEVLKKKSTPEGEENASLYMAPELYHNEAHDISVDIYSFGMILYEMFEGRINTVEEQVLKNSKVSMTTPNLQFQSSEYPENMQRFISSCLESDPTKRPSAEELLSYLEEKLEVLNERDSPAKHPKTKVESPKMKTGCHCCIL